MRKPLGVAVGAGEINEETDEQLSTAQEEVKSLRARIQKLEEENADLRAQTTQVLSNDAP